MPVGTWRLQGYDTFACQPYPLPGGYTSEADAIAAARRRLAELEQEQPSESSGGQGEDGIQDRVLVVQPDGTTLRVL